MQGIDRLVGSTTLASRHPEGTLLMAETTNGSGHPERTEDAAPVPRLRPLPTGVIDFQYLQNRAGSPEGGRALFEKMIVQLVALDYPQVQNLRALPGDWGIDGLIGELDDVVSVWQAKYFIERFDKSQKSQITRSLNSLIKKAKEEGFRINAWTLCVPIDLEPDAMQWWHRLSRKMKKEHDLVCDLWSATQLERRLLREDGESARKYFFPAEEDELRLRDVVPLPDSTAYEESLFIAQLEAAGVTQIRPAKVEFFNAEILTRDVHAKKDDDEVKELMAVRAEVHSLWAHRYDSHCEEHEGDRLPGLHGRVMEAVENNYNATPPKRLRSRAIHHFGVTHQLSDEGQLGWTRGYEMIAAQYV